MCLLNEYVEYNKHPVSRYLMGYVFYDKTVRSLEKVENTREIF